MISGILNRKYQAAPNLHYNLEVNFSIVDGNVIIIGASMTRLNGKYLGYWPAQQMPKALIREFKQEIRGISWEIDIDDTDAQI